MKTNTFVKVCRQRNNIETQINQMSTKEAIELKADLKRKISVSSNAVSLLTFELSFFTAFLSLMISAMGKEAGQKIGFTGAIVTIVLFVVAIIGSLVCAWRNSNHEEALSCLEDYLQEKNKKAHAEQQMELYQSLLTGLLEEKEEG